MHESMLAYAGKRYLWVALGLIAIAAVAYGLQRPVEPPNGGTWLGYTLGSVAALLILWLIAFGIRKRSYHSNLGTVRGWLSAHVYLGTALLAIATLHTGFQFGWNVHTLAYALMCIVIASGLVGVVLYLRYPTAMSANRAGTNREQLLADVADIDQKAARIASQLPREYADLEASNRDRTVVGGSAFALLAGGDRSRLVLPDSQTPVANAEQAAILAWLGDRLSRSTEGARSQLIQDLLGLISLRKAQLARLRRDLKLQAWLEIWLYVHVPLSFALLAALATHVIVVFLYW
jgi:hypothetical protein